MSNVAGSKASLAALIEMIGSFFGLMGLGHIYSGRVLLGIMLMIGWMTFILIELVLTSLTGGFFACIALPLHLIGMAWSSYSAYQYASTI